MIHDIQCSRMKGRMKGDTLSQWPPCVSCGNRPRLYLKKIIYIDMKRNKASLLQFLELFCEQFYPGYLKKKPNCCSK